MFLHDHFTTLKPTQASAKNILLPERRERMSGPEVHHIPKNYRCCHESLRVSNYLRKLICFIKKRFWNCSNVVILKAFMSRFLDSAI